MIVLAYTIWHGSLLTYALIQQQRFVGQISLNDDTRITLNEITVIIPFRNEEKRIDALLNSISKLKNEDIQFIFVDDHSTDHSVEKIKQANLKIPHQITSSKHLGKKHSIQHGIELSNTKFILTMDADCGFEVEYLEAIQRLNPAVSMHILPVKMESSMCHKWMELDVYCVNALNVIASGISRPIAASGANLLFKKEAYLQFNQLEKHVATASGDDQFLLANLNHAKLPVQLHIDAALAISTPAPTSIREFIHQRVRWIQKTPKVKDHLATLIGGFQFATNLFFLAAVITSACTASFSDLIILIVLKSTLDSLTVYLYLKKIGKLQLLVILPIYAVIFPIYSLLIGLLALTMQPTWKGRKI